MKREAINKYYIHNGELVSTDVMDIFDRIGEKSVYEVIKIKEGIPLYFEEHMIRMKNSLSALGMKLMKTDRAVLQEVIQLVKINQCEFINVKLVYEVMEGGESNFLVYFIKSEYPQEDIYKKGIHTILFQGERETPNIKTVSGSFREKVQRAREDEAAYEALLVDEDGMITEGSRSNVFFVKEEELITPPGGQVLLGVTRNYVLKICHQLGIKVKEDNIHVDDLKNIQGAFITGTTVDVLPISSIDTFQLSPDRNETMKNIIDQYNIEMRQDIEKRKKSLIKQDIIL